MPRQTIDQDDPQLTAYALGEMSQQEREEFELRLQDSPLAKRELAAMNEVMAVMGESLEEEWKRHAEGQAGEIHKTETALTAYALNEMSAEHSAEFERELNQSGPLREELASMKDFVSLLNDSLESEWKQHAPAPTAGLKEVQRVNRTDGSSFRARGWGMGIAAACAAMLAVGSLFVDRSHVEDDASGSWASVDESKVVNSVDATGDSDEAAEIRVPTLFLAEELRGMEGDIPSVNAGYLEEGRILKASFQPHSSSQPTSSSSGGGIDPLWFKEQLDRVDSYLPPVTEGNVSFEMKTGSYDGRPAKTYLVADRRNHDNGTASVYVRGLVTMDSISGELDMNSISSQVLAEVDPGLVSSSESGRFPASTADSQRSLAAGFEEMQTSLSRVVREMEALEGTASASQLENFRSQLREILERGEAIGSTLHR